MGVFLQSTPYIGTLGGILIIGIFADNIGRRFSLMVCLGTGVVGFLIMILSKTLTFALIGLCVVNIGVESGFSLVLFLVS